MYTVNKTNVRGTLLRKQMQFFQKILIYRENPIYLARLDSYQSVTLVSVCGGKKIYFLSLPLPIFYLVHVRFSVYFLVLENSCSCEQLVSGNLIIASSEQLLPKQLTSPVPWYWN